MIRYRLAALPFSIVTCCLVFFMPVGVPKHVTVGLLAMLTASLYAAQHFACTDEERAKDPLPWTDMLCTILWAFTGLLQFVCLVCKLLLEA